MQIPEDFHKDNMKVMISHDHSLSNKLKILKKKKDTLKFNYSFRFRTNVIKTWIPKKLKDRKLLENIRLNV